jgi:hypothetical protein
VAKLMTIDPQARGYAEMKEVVEQGLETLRRLVESL